MRVSVEVCVTTLGEATAAHRIGADRVELCSWASCGGITPGMGLVRAMQKLVPIPQRVLVRTRPHGFVHDPMERSVLLEDVRSLAGGGFGIVTGGLTAEGNVDRDLMGKVMTLAGNTEVTLHRALDDASDLEAAMTTAIEIGVQRVLSSGGAASALDGAATLARAVDLAGEHLLVAAAGGINPVNVVELVERTGVREVHFLAQRRVPLGPKGIPMSSDTMHDPYAVLPDEAKIEGVLLALTKAGLR